ncbi:MAG: hypothetical protein ACXW2U_01040 [Telluria sp.]
MSAQIADDHGNYTANATAVQLGASIAGTIVPSNIDWLKVALVAGTTYTFALGTVDLVSPFVMALVDDTGQSIVAPSFDSRPG